MSKFKKFILVAILSLIYSGASLCFADDPAPLSNILNLNTQYIPSEAVTKKDLFADIRPKAIRQAARTLGTQSGAKWRYDEIQKVIEKINNEKDLLGRVYDFKNLLLHDGRVLPPVIVTAKSSIKIESNLSAVETGTSYRILQPAKMVGNAPSWRNFLCSNAFTVAKVHEQVLPKKENSEEIEIWKKGCREGWAIGVEQADTFFEQQLRKLDRVVLGIVEFNLLECQGLVSLPSVSEGHYAVRVGEKNLDINQRTFRINRSSRFQSVQKWVPLGAK